MIIVLMGPSGSGKSTIEKELENFGIKRIVSCTTRTPREGEIDGVDYHFMSFEDFMELVGNKKFAEYRGYSNNRFYGTLIESYKSDNWESLNLKVVTVTPAGYRNLIKRLECEKFMEEDTIFSVLIDAPLSVRMKRYIDRCGEKFNFSDKDELCTRVERDFGMFEGVENEVQAVLYNDGTRTPREMARLILQEAGYTDLC